MFINRLYIIVACIITLAGMASANSLSMSAKGEGVSDDSAAIQEALDKCAATGGGVVTLEAGKYRLDKPINVPAGVTLSGVWEAPHHVNFNSGTLILAYAGKGKESDPPLIKLNASSTIKGISIYYPEQTIPAIPFPWTIQIEGVHCNVLDVTLSNPYKAIDFGTYPNELHHARNVFGCPLKVGVFVDRCTDIGRVENVHFNPNFWTRIDNGESIDGNKLVDYIGANGVAFEFARSDWQYVLNTFCYGYNVGYKFSECQNGGCNGNFVGLGADCCERAVLIEQVQPAGLLITNGEFVGRLGSVDSITCDIGPKTVGKVSLNNCSFWGPINRCIRMNAPIGQLTAIGCHFNDWDIQSTGAPAIELNAGRAIIQGNTFVNGRNHIKIGPQVKSAVVMGNQTIDGMIIQNSIGKNLISIGNNMNTVKFPNSAKENYKVFVGADGDTRYIGGWSGREKAMEWDPPVGTKRWSTDNAKFFLPVVPGKKYKVMVDAYIPKYALMDGAGLYVNGKKIAAITKEGVNVLTGTIPASKTGEITLELKVNNWYPANVIPNSTDVRHLGIAVRSLTMKAEGAGNKVFNANKGEWIK